MRILVVEDDKDVAGFVVKGLREAGHLAEHADNGRDGLFLAASESFDAIILDRMLPGGIDGLRLLETLRAQDNATPVLFLSALGQVDDRVRGLKAGGDDYLTKPFAFAELLARVEALARRGRSDGPQTKLLVGDLEMDLLSRSVQPRRPAHRPAAARVPPAGIHDAPRRPGRDAHHAAGGRVGLPFRPADQRDRRACQPAAAEDRQAVRHARCSTPCATPATCCARSEGARHPGPRPLALGRAAAGARLLPGCSRSARWLLVLFLWWATAGLLDRQVEAAIRADAQGLSEQWQGGGLQRCRRRSRTGWRRTWTTTPSTC